LIPLWSPLSPLSLLSPLIPTRLDITSTMEYIRYSVNRNIILIVVVVLVLAAGYFAFTNNQKTAQPVATAPVDEYEGKDKDVYTGQIPCADCPGIEVKLAIKENGKYKMSSTYLERDVEPLVEKGTWTNKKGDATNPDANVLVLTSTDNKVTYFLTTPSGISQLEENLQPVTNPYAMNLEKKK
jgi:copper homeostasis protein (lipoprotein)